MSKNIDDLLTELARANENEINEEVTNKRVKRILQLLETARKELSAEIKADPITGSRARELAKQIDKLRKGLASDLDDLPNTVDQLAKFAVDHFAAETSVITGKAVDIAIDRVSSDILYLIAENNLTLVKDDIVDSQLRKIKTRIFTNIGVKGENPRQVAQKLAGTDSEFAGMYHRIENIMRTETSTIYNTQKQAAIEEANKISDYTFHKKIVEIIDLRRNHPISLVLNGLVQDVKKPFKAKVSDVETAAKRLGGRGLRRGGGVGGIFWTKQNGYYIGDRLPAHYQERGTMVPTEEPISESQK